MFALTILTIVGAMASALAAPLAPRQSSDVVNTFLMSVRSASPIHFQAVNASDNSFFIGRPTNAVCPVAAPECAGFPNTTIVSIDTDTSVQYQAFMYAVSPGGQNVYVKESGALSFTTPHTEYNFPPNSYTSGFQYSTDESNVSFLTFTNGSATTWTACPITTKVQSDYQVFADVVGFNNSVVPTGNTADCLSFGMVVANRDDSATMVGAFQYD